MGKPADGSRIAAARGNPIALAGLVLLVCLGATYAFWHVVSVDSDRRLRGIFESSADDVAAHIEARLRRHGQLLRGAMSVSGDVEKFSRRDFRAYLQSQQIAEDFPEIRRIGLAVVVERRQRDRHVSQMRAGGAPDYRIRPDGERPVYAPVLYLEGTSGDSDLVPGLDLYSNAVRHEAMDRAGRLGGPTLSGMLREASGNRVDLVAPIYGESPADMTDGTRTAIGWIFSEISMEEMMGGPLRHDFDELAGRIDVRIYDDANLESGSLLYGASGPPAAAAGGISTLRQLDFGGRRWDIVMHPLPAFEASGGHREPLFAVAAGVACSILLAALTWALASARNRAHLEATRMNRELVRSEGLLREANAELERRVAQRTRELETTAERLTLSAATSNTGIWDWNLLTQEVHYSAEWTRQLGFEPHEIGATLDEWQGRLHPADRDRVLATLRERLGERAGPCEIEFRLRHRDGGYRTILCHAQVYADASGRPVRVIGSHLDVTERKRAEGALLKLTQELRESWRQLSNVEEADRRWLASELHDSIGSALTALNLNLTIVRDRLPAEARTALEPRLNDSIRLLEETVDTVRDLMAQLRPPVLDDYGLATALRWYVDQVAARADLDATFRLNGADERFPAEVEIALFRIAQGALTNVVKHANARHVPVSMEVAPRSLRMEIADDGRGFGLEQADADMRCPHWGLVTMRERAESIGGRCAIESIPGRGTRVVVEVPRQP